MIITRAPFRLSFFGGGTDYLPWIQENNGLIIATGLGYYNYVCLRELPPLNIPSLRGKKKVGQPAFPETESHPNPFIQACLHYFGKTNHYDIKTSSDLPIGAGIGSSSALIVSLVKGLKELSHERITRYQLAKMAIEIEQTQVIHPTGIQDSIITTFGKFSSIKIKKGGNWQVAPLNLSADYLECITNHLLLGFSGIRRKSGAYAKKQIEGIKSRQNTAKLNEIMGITMEALTGFKMEMSMKELGNLLDAAWQIKRNLDANISPDWMDGIYQTGIKNGALGGKLMGAGGGGFFFFVAPPDKHAKIQDALPQVPFWVPVKLKTGGAQVVSKGLIR